MGAKLTQMWMMHLFSATTGHCPSIMAVQKLSYHGCAFVINTVRVSIFWFISSFFGHASPYIYWYLFLCVCFCVEKNHERLAHS